jgi:hypothetical protein
MKNAPFANQRVDDSIFVFFFVEIDRIMIICLSKLVVTILINYQENLMDQAYVN